MFNGNKHRACATVLAVVVATGMLAASPAFADTEDLGVVKNDDGRSTIGDLGIIQTRTIMTTARVNLKKQQDLLTPDAPKAGAFSAQPVTQTAASVLPNVRYIINDTASFVFSDGSHTDGRVGSVLPGGWKVSAISAADRSVTIKDHSNREYHLAISSSAPQAPVSNSQQSAQMGSPMMPPQMMGMPGQVRR
ncbi:hypothetical protein [Burkholderia vietnamiensis]|uniref:hypothetical protein n=1 Tax=Burkholderia vietnamiensis TaxID=60552 RepID=UPI001CF17753|nr:hypothetical protein [Burkholderia vietnamiensis]MCA8228149.1 hypothetical protein [Burkholderia vietnamiensis]